MTKTTIHSTSIHAIKVMSSNMWCSIGGTGFVGMLQVITIDYAIAQIAVAMRIEHSNAVFVSWVMSTEESSDEYKFSGDQGTITLII